LLSAIDDPCTIDHEEIPDMSIKALSCAVLMLVAMGVADAQVNALPPSPHILVYGDAKARAIPDRFKIQVDFEVIDMKPDVARRRVESYLQETIRQLEANAVPASEIVATSLQIEPRKEYDADTRQQVFKGIAVSRTLSARFKDQEKLKSFLGGLETSEEVQVSGVSTELSDEPALMKKLRGMAILSTREKAEVIAESYGVRIAGLYSVSDTAPQFDYGIQEGSWPVTYQWHRSGGATQLDRIEVTGSRVTRSDLESFETGYVDFEDKIYAVFLITE
jgi:uncharacterized protein YggE